MFYVRHTYKLSSQVECKGWKEVDKRIPPTTLNWFHRVLFSVREVVLPYPGSITENCYWEPRGTHPFSLYSCALWILPCFLNTQEQKNMITTPLGHTPAPLRKSQLLKATASPLGSSVFNCILRLHVLERYNPQ